jgi:uncharacterized membrane protein
MRNAPEPDSLLFLIGGWFGLVLLVSLGWMLLALISYHGAASSLDAAVIMLGPATLSGGIGLAAFVAWLVRRPQLAAGIVLTTMLAVLGLLLNVSGAFK